MIERDFSLFPFFLREKGKGRKKRERTLTTTLFIISLSFSLCHIATVKKKKKISRSLHSKTLNHLHSVNRHIHE